MHFCLSVFDDDNNIAFKLGAFLLLTHYIPNVVKRSISDQCKKKYILTTDRRPTDQRPHIWEISNDHVSARGRPIHFMFGSTVRFSGSADRMAPFPVSPNPRLKNSNGDISPADRPIYSVFGSRMGFSRSSDRMALFPFSPNPRWRCIQMAISPWQIIRFALFLVLGLGFRGRRIEWR